MTKHITGTRKEWLEARMDLLKEEKELTQRSDEPARRRQELPWAPVDTGTMNLYAGHLPFGYSVAASCAVYTMTACERRFRCLDHTIRS